MRLAQLFCALVFSITLFSSCTVEDINEDTQTLEFEEAVATGDDDNPIDEDKDIGIGTGG